MRLERATGLEIRTSRSDFDKTGRAKPKSKDQPRRSDSLRGWSNHRVAPGVPEVRNASAVLTRRITDPLRSSAVSLIPFFRPKRLDDFLVRRNRQASPRRNADARQHLRRLFRRAVRSQERQAVENHRRRILDPDLVDELAFLPSRRTLDHLRPDQAIQHALGQAIGKPSSRRTSPGPAPPED